MKTLFAQVFLSLMLVSSVFAGSDLKLKLEKGQKFKFESSINQNISQEIMGATQSYINNMVFEYEAEVTAVEGDAITINFTYTRVYLYSYNDNTGVNEFDTRKKEGEVPEHYKQFDALVGESIVAKMNTYGEVSSVEGLEDLYNHMIEKMKPADEEATREQLTANYSEENIKNDIENLFGVLPGKEVAAGESWEEEKEVNNRFPISIKSKYTMDKLSKKKAIISVSSSLESDPEKTTFMNDMEFRYNLSGTQSGKVILNPNNGVLIENKTHQEISGDMEVVSGVLAGQKIPMSFKTDAVIKLL